MKQHLADKREQDIQGKGMCKFMEICKSVLLSVNECLVCM